MRALLLAVAISYGCAVKAWSGAEDLRQQLEWAREAGQSHSQIEIIRRILEAESQNSALREELVNLWLEVGDVEMALATVTAWEEAPAELAAVVQARQCGADDPGKAAEILGVFLQAEPTAPMATSELADLLLRQAKNRELVSFLDGSPLIPESVDLLLKRAQANRGAGDFPAALNDFSAAARLAPDNPEVQRRAASFERLEEAAPHLLELTKAIEKDSQDFAALVMRSFWGTYAGLPHSQARADAEAGLAVQPASKAALICAAVNSGLSPWDVDRKFGVNLSPLPSSDGLARLLALDRKASSGAAEALLERAAFLSGALSQPGLALQDAELVLEEEPENAGALLQKITALGSLGRGEEAAATYIALESSRPTKSQLAEGLFQMGKIQFASSRLDAALESAGASIALSPTASAYELRAAILERLGRSAEASTDLATASTLKKTR